MLNFIELRFPGGLERALTFSYDDTCRQNARLLALFRKYGMKGTFNLNAGFFHEEGAPYPDPMPIAPHMTERECKELFEAYPEMEIACHGFDHTFLERSPRTMQLYETLADRRGLEKLFGRIVNGMAYPFGTYNAEVIDSLRACGIHYCRTVHATRAFTLPEEWLALNPTCHHREEKLPELIDEFLAPSKNPAPRMFYIWGHAYEFDMHSNWEMMEDYLARLAGKNDVWYATNGEIYDYVKCYEQLIASADFSLLHNPTATDVWLSLNGGEPVCIPAGKTVGLPEVNVPHPRK